MKEKRSKIDLIDPDVGENEYDDLLPNVKRQKNKSKPNQPMSEQNNDEEADLDGYGESIDDESHKTKRSDSSGKKIIIVLITIICLGVLAAVIIRHTSRNDDNIEDFQLETLRMQIPEEAPYLGEISENINSDSQVVEDSGSGLSEELYQFNQTILTAGLRSAAAKMFSMVKLDYINDTPHISYFVPSVNLDASVIINIEVFDIEGQRLADGLLMDGTSFNPQATQNPHISYQGDMSNIAVIKIVYSIIKGDIQTPTNLNTITKCELEIHVTDSTQSKAIITEMISNQPESYIASFDISNVYAW